MRLRLIEWPELLLDIADCCARSRLLCTLARLFSISLGLRCHLDAELVSEPLEAWLDGIVGKQHTEIDTASDGPNAPLHGSSAERFHDVANAGIDRHLLLLRGRYCRSRLRLLLTETHASTRDSNCLLLVERQFCHSLRSSGVIASQTPCSTPSGAVPASPVLVGA